MLIVSYSISAFVEAEDTFCISCHTEPEITYYNDSQNKNAKETLAAFHGGKDTKCIDCHSRPNITGKLWAQINGLKHAIVYLSGDYEPVSKTSRPVGESGCTKCHSEIFWSLERPSHYHSPLLKDDWKKAGGPSNLCEVCHPSHLKKSTEENNFMVRKEMHKQCKKCHKAIGDDRVKHLMKLETLEGLPVKLKK